jgi:hypothetical protein
VKEVLEEKVQKNLLAQGKAIQEFITQLGLPPASTTREGPEYACENARTLAEQFESEVEALRKEIPGCSHEPEDLRQPLKCRLRTVDELAKNFGAQQTQWLNTCATHNLCAPSTAQARRVSVEGKPVLDMVVGGICDKGLGGNQRRSLLLDTTGLVSLYKEQGYKQIQHEDPLSPDSIWDVLGDVKRLSGLPQETQDWKDALGEARDGLERLRREYDGVRRIANQFAHGEYKSVETLVGSASKTLATIGDRCPKSSEAVRTLIRDFDRLPDPLPQLYSGGKGYFAPVESRGAAEQLRKGRDRLYEDLKLKHDQLRRECVPPPLPEPPAVCPSPSTETVPSS